MKEDLLNFSLDRGGVKEGNFIATRHDRGVVTALTNQIVTSPHIASWRTQMGLRRELRDY